MLIAITVKGSTCYQDEIWKDCILDNLGRYTLDEDSMYDTSAIVKHLRSYLYRYHVNTDEIDIITMRDTVHTILSKTLKSVPYKTFRLTGVRKQNTLLTFRVEDC